MPRVRKSRTRKCYNKSRPLRVEPLERRELLSVNWADGELHIVCTEGDDTVSVEPSYLHCHDPDSPAPIDWSIEFNGTELTYHMPAPSKIVFYGLEGDDVFWTYLSYVPVEAHGGEGNDALVGSLGDDLLFGGPGRDTLYSFDGNDRIAGGPGPDSLAGGDGVDQLYGDDCPVAWYSEVTTDVAGLDDATGDSTDTDSLARFPSKWPSPDTLIGGPGNDTLVGGPGDDLLWGEGDDDDLFGEAGDDRLLGGTGRDNLFGGAGSDALFGGVDDVRDELHGDDVGHWHADRFLTRPADATHYLCPSDVEIRVLDGSAKWDEMEVFYVDAGLERLQDAAGSTLILKDPLGDAPLELVKDTLVFAGSTRELALGYNEHWTDADRQTHSRIHLAEYDADGKASDFGRGREVVRQIAANWDDSRPAQTAAHPAGFDYWEDFVSATGRATARQDWTDCWEAVVFDDSTPIDRARDPDRLARGLEIMEEFFAEFRSASKDTSGDRLLETAYKDLVSEQDSQDEKQAVIAATDLLMELHFAD